MNVVPNAARHQAAGDGYAGSERSPWIIVALVAALVEFILLATIFTYLHRTPVPLVHLQPLQIVLEPLVPKPPSKAKKPTPAPQPRTQLPLPVPRPEIVRPRPIHEPVAPPKIVAAPPPPPTPVAQTPQLQPSAPAPKVDLPPPPYETRPAMPVVQPPSKSASAPAQLTIDQNALRVAYGKAMHTAIQSAVRYPDMARRMGLSGKVLVAFIVQHGVVQNVHVVTTSGSGILDRAALRAVRNAAYPPLPVSLENDPLPLQLWIRFKLDQYDGS